MKRSFTLIELLIVVIIIGILATIVAPSFTKTMEKAKADQAKLYLKAIRTGEKIYYSNNSTYIACADALAIKSNLSAEVTTENYTFSVTSNTTDTFLATATRKTDSKTITLDQDGTWGGTSPYK